jgi:hypothetical protein
VDRRGRAREVVDLVYFYIKWKGDVVPDDFEMSVADELSNIVASPSKKIVDAQHVMAFCK